MKRIERTIKIGKMSLAAITLVMLLALGGLTVTNSITNGNMATLLSAGQTTSQQIAVKGAVAVTDAASQTTSAGTAEQTAATQLTQQQSGVVDARYAVQQAGSAVVTVINTMQQSTTSQGRFGYGGQSPAAQASGSGVIIDSQGYIVTNQHVVANQQSLEVIFADGTKAPATLIGADAYTDIAVIKVDAKVPAVAKFGDSDKLEAGQPVVAIGTALGDYSNTVTEGIISGLHRELGDGSTSTQDMIQTDAAINSGNSGGPLLDLSGNVIGINTAVVRGTGSMGDIAEGLGFAIPSNTVKAVVDQLIKSGSISHPYLGVSYQVITPQIAATNNLSSQQGVFVTDVAAGSPAANAGIQPNSIITKFDGVTLGTDSSSSLTTLLSGHKVGDSVKLIVIAPGASSAKEITVVLGTRPGGQ